MLKSALFGCLVLTVVSSVQAASCIVSGETDRSCSASGSAIAGGDVRAVGVLDGPCAATVVKPFDFRGWSFCWSNVLTVFDCLGHPYSLILVK